MSEYTLGGNSSNIGTVLSLKANSRLIRDISQHSSNQACIEFTSSTTARISVGDEHYDLSFADVKTTVCVFYSKILGLTNFIYHASLSCRMFIVKIVSEITLTS